MTAAAVRSSAEATFVVAPPLALLFWLSGAVSFPVALAVGVVMGIAQTEVDRYVSTINLPGWGFNTPGWGRSVPFLVIVIWMAIRGQALPLRDY